MPADRIYAWSHPTRPDWVVTLLISPEGNAVLKQGLLDDSYLEQRILSRTVAALVLLNALRTRPVARWSSSTGQYHHFQPRS